MSLFFGSEPKIEYPNSKFTSTLPIEGMLFIYELTIFIFTDTLCLSWSEGQQFPPI